MSRTAHIQLRLRPAEKIEIETRAEDAGLSASEYIRRRALGHVSGTKMPPPGEAAGVDFDRIERTVLALARRMPLAEALRRARAELGL